MNVFAQWLETSDTQVYRLEVDSVTKSQELLFILSQHGQEDLKVLRIMKSLNINSSVTGEQTQSVEDLIFQKLWDNVVDLELAPAISKVRNKL